MTDGPVLDTQDLPENLRESQTEVATATELISLDELRNRHVIRVLEQVGGNKVRAAEILGIGRGTLYRFLSKIESERKRDSMSPGVPALVRSRSGSI